MNNYFNNCSCVVSHLNTKNEDGLTTDNVSTHSNVFDCHSHKSIEGMAMTEEFREWLCHLLYEDRLFNSDMSLEIDRLIQENEKLKARMNE